MILDFWPSCLQLPNAGTAWSHHHACPMWCGDWTQGFTFARQALYQMSYRLSPSDWVLMNGEGLFKEMSNSRWTGKKKMAFLLWAQPLRLSPKVRIQEQDVLREWRVLAGIKWRVLKGGKWSLEYRELCPEETFPLHSIVAPQSINITNDSYGARTEDMLFREPFCLALSREAQVSQWHTT